MSVRAAILLAVSALPVASVQAGEAKVIRFGPTAAEVIEYEAGVSTRSNGFFALRTMNARPPAPVAAPAAAPAPAASDAPTAPASIVTSPIVRRESGPSSCGYADAVDYADLNSATKALRRFYHPLVRDAECRHGLPAGLLDSLVLAESRYRIGAVSTAGAVGLTQLMPGTAADLGVSNRLDATASIYAGARYLRQMIDRFGSVTLGVAAYNAGPGSVQRARGIPMNGETPTYVSRVLGRWWGAPNAAASRREAPPPAPPSAVQLLEF